jgi:hypothetical protein
MPLHLEGAYTEHACYGLPVGQVAEGVEGVGDLSAEEIESLTDFLLEHVVGNTRITRENCAVFFDGDVNAPACRQY